MTAMHHPLPGIKSGGSVDFKEELSMKRFGRLLAVTAAAGVLLTGCSAQAKSTFNPSASCVYVAQDGALSSALVKEYEGEAVDEKDLRQYLEAAVIRFNEANGAEALAENKQGSDRLPAALQSVSAEKGVLKAVFDYASTEDLIAFRQTEENEDTSNTITALEVKKAAEAESAGWLSGAAFVKADGSAAAAEEITKDAGNTVVSVEGGATVVCAGTIVCLTEEAEKKDEHTAVIPDGGKALIVFK